MREHTSKCQREGGRAQVALCLISSSSWEGAPRRGARCLKKRRRPSRSLNSFAITGMAVTTIVQSRPAMKQPSMRAESTRRKMVGVSCS